MLQCKSVSKVEFSCSFASITADPRHQQDLTKHHFIVAKCNTVIVISSCCFYIAQYIIFIDVVSFTNPFPC